jgi:molecular chaperone DnaK (HSP70)
MSTAPARVTDCPLDRVSPPDPSTRGKGPVIAIDMGTTSCRVAAMQKGAPVCIPAQRQSGSPSYVALGSGGRILIGNAAQQQMSSAPSHAVWGIKGLLSAPYGDPRMQWLYEQLRCPLTAGADGRPAVQLGDRLFSAKELAALLFFEARERAQNFLQQPVYRAMLTLPPTRDAWLRAAMNEAAALAGLHVERMITEPMAVALAAWAKRPGVTERRILVCDWGGGSFQASLVKVSAQGCEVLAAESQVAVCGAELDKRLLRWMLRTLPPGVRLAADAKNPAAFFRLADAAERAKTQLSERQEVRVHVPFATLTAEGQPGDFSLVLTRKTLEELATPLVDAAVALCEQLLEQQFLLPGEVDEVLLVGEQAQMPLFQERMERLFSLVPLYVEEPGLAVVLGAAKLTALLEASAPPAGPSRTPTPLRR